MQRYFKKLKSTSHLTFTTQTQTMQKYFDSEGNEVPAPPALQRSEPRLYDNQEEYDAKTFFPPPSKLLRCNATGEVDDGIMEDTTLDDLTDKMTKLSLIDANANEEREWKDWIDFYYRTFPDSAPTGDFMDVDDFCTEIDEFRDYLPSAPFSPRSRA
jgi:hypothetical protein